MKEFREKASERRQKFIKKLDTDGDGVVSEAEKEAGKKFRKQDKKGENSKGKQKKNTK